MQDTAKIIINVERGGMQIEAEGLDPILIVGILEMAKQNVITSISSSKETIFKKK